MKKNRYKGLGLLLTAAMIFSLPGCGKQKIEDIEYVDEGSTENGSENGNSSKTGDQTDQPLAKRLGVDDKLLYKEEFDIQGNKIKIDINQKPQDIDRIPSYSAIPVTYDEEKENTIVNNLFGDTAKKIDVDPADYLSPNDENLSGSGENVVHVYEGLYGGHICRFIYIYTDYNNTISMSMRPDDIAGFINASGKKYMHQFYSSRGIYSVMSEQNMADFDDDESSDTEEPDYQDEMISVEETQAFIQEMNDMPNRYTATDDELYGIAYKFMKDTLGISILSEAISVNEYGINMYETGNEEGEEESIRTELVFTDSKEFNASMENREEVIKDGYAVTYSSFIEDMNATTNRSDYLCEDNYGWINITDEGIIGFDYTYGYLLDEKLSEDVQILSFNDVMECLKNDLIENLDVKSLKTSQVVFDNCFLMYYGMKSPDGGNEYTFIPVWLFSGNNDGNAFSEVLINAVDGSLIMMRYY